jgi:putative transposase
MDCLDCSSTAAIERPDLTGQGYRRCRDRGTHFNEHSGGVLIRVSLPSDIIASVVFYRLRCESWYADEAYLKVKGRWSYLYRAIDRDGNRIDTMLTATRDMRAPQRFFRSAQSVVGFVPDRVTTDGNNSCPRAIRSTLGRNVRHRANVYLNNRLEQYHRGIDAADRFCREYDELHNFDRHHADRMISSSNEHTAPQPARGATESERLRLPSMSWQLSDCRNLCRAYRTDRIRQNTSDAILR